MRSEHMSDAQIRAALTDVEAVALTLWGEARSEPLEGVIAVGCVIRNRKRTGLSSWHRVVHRRLQFSCWWPQGGKENFNHVMLRARVLVNGDRLEGSQWEECVWIAEGIVHDRVRDTLPKDTRHYLTSKLLRNEPPVWAEEARVVGVIGNHTFLAGVA
jgi:N-acetylmuramoyl-L-alanine amidase